jgi:hypothetical protein
LSCCSAAVRSAGSARISVPIGKPVARTAARRPEVGWTAGNWCVLSRTQFPSHNGAGRARV